MVLVIAEKNGNLHLHEIKREKMNHKIIVDYSQSDVINFIVDSGTMIDLNNQDGCKKSD